MAPKEADKNNIAPWSSLRAYLAIIRMPLLVYAVFSVISTLIFPMAYFLNLIVLFILAFQIGNKTVHQSRGTVANAAKAGLLFGLAAGLICALVGVACGLFVMKSLSDLGSVANGTDGTGSLVAGKLQAIESSIMLAYMIGTVIVLPVVTIAASVTASVIGACAFRD